MTTEQIYSLVNEINSQAFGRTDLTVTDTSSLISLGNTVLSSTNNTEAFLNTLAQRIGRTILRFRKYRNKLGDMVLNDFEYGAILQKIKVKMPQAEADQSVDLVDGQSVDHFKIAKPQADQKLFVTRTPYQYHITIQRFTLKEAFLNIDAMGAFISVVFGEVRNAIELGLENLSRVTLATAIGETAGTSREIKLVTKYNAEMGTALDPGYAAMKDPDFMRYAVSVMNTALDDITDMSASYNDGTLDTFTPIEDARLKVISEFKRRMETVVQYAAFNERFVDINKQYQILNFWQAAKSRYSIDITIPSTDTEVKADWVVAVLHDRDAMGVYKWEEEVLTTPVNAAGRYYNTYWHEQQLRFIDKSENILIFTLT